MDLELNILQQFFSPTVYQTWWIKAPDIYKDGISLEDNKIWPQNVMKKKKQNKQTNKNKTRRRKLAISTI